MIEQFFRPETVVQAMELKKTYRDDAVYLGRGSKLNATPTKTQKTVAISLSRLGLNYIQQPEGQLQIGAMMNLRNLQESPKLPAVLRDAISFVYSRNIRNQATLGGEIAAVQRESVLIPALLVLQTKLVLGSGETVDLEEYINGPRQELILSALIPESKHRYATRKVSRSAGGLAVLTAAMALTSNGEMRIALDGVTERPIRLRDVESRNLSDTALEQAVGEAISPRADLCGSAEYKRYIAGVVVADLLVECQQMKGEK